MGFLLCERRGSGCQRPSVSWTKQKKDRAHPVFAGFNPDLLHHSRAPLSIQFVPSSISVMERK